MISENKGSTDVYQSKLEMESPLEVLRDKQNNIIKTSHTKLRPLFDKTYLPYIYWTRDMTNTLDSNYNTKPDECNLKVFKDRTPEEYLQNMYIYRCSLDKLIYYIKVNGYIEVKKLLSENMICDITTPEFHQNNPYQFIYYIQFYGKSFNYYNTYFSRFIYEYIRDYIVIWFNSIPIAKNLKAKIIYGDDVSQIYYQKNNINKINSSAMKIQLNIKDEYFFWAVETIKRNFKKLCHLGIYRFKFMSSLVMLKILKNEEFYPNFYDRKKMKTVDEYFFEYMFLDKVYKRELLIAPNIVFYLEETVEKEGKLGIILNELCNMFPDNLDISNGIPRFNIRINNNIFFSLDGDNEFKFDRELLIDKKIPYEYQTIINICNSHLLTEEQCNKLNEYSEYLSGHSLLKFHDGNCIQNNILSYLILLPSNYNSFHELFIDDNLFDYDVLEFLGNHIKFMTIDEFLIKNYTLFGDEILKGIVNFKNAGMNYRIKSKKRHDKTIRRIYKSKHSRR